MDLSTSSPEKLQQLATVYDPRSSTYSPQKGSPIPHKPLLAEGGEGSHRGSIWTSGLLLRRKKWKGAAATPPVFLLSCFLPWHFDSSSLVLPLSSPIVGTTLSLLLIFVSSAAPEEGPASLRHILNSYLLSTQPSKVLGNREEGMGADRTLTPCPL